MIAAASGNGAVAKVLIERGAQLGLKNFQGQTAWDIALAKGHPDIARLILKSGRAGQLQPPDGGAATAPAVDKAEMERMIAQAVEKATSQTAAAPATKASDVDQPRYKTRENPDNFAIVIGIEHYSDIPEAEFAEHDAAAMRDHLVALGYPQRNIISLLGPKATKTGIVKNIETWLPRNVNEKSTVFIYYSGHGAPDVKTGQSYLVPWDGDPQFLEDTAYPVKRLYEKLNALKAGRVIVALDSCFSGAGGRSVLAKGVRPLVTKVDSVLGNGKVMSLSASGPEQTSGSLPEQGHGLFTYYVLRGLNGEAQDKSGGVTMDSLYRYLQTHVADEARRRNNDQNPQMAPAGSDAAALRLR
jgi:hypothetical protein